MAKLTVFYLTGCPYCANAKRALAELCAETPAYAAVELDWLEEREHAATAEQYDYYYVPSVFLGAEKLYEAQPGERYEDCRANLRRCLDRALA